MNPLHYVNLVLLRQEEAKLYSESCKVAQRRFVVEAFLARLTIEYKDEYGWHVTDDPKWLWDTYHYRVKK